VNSTYRDLILANVQAAVGAARAAKGITHKGLKGQLREIVIRDLFRPLLPADVGVGTGKIITADNHQSRQKDIVIFDKRILPPILFEGRTGLFPVESVLYTIEVKSILTKGELKSSHTGASELLDFNYISGKYDDDNEPIDHKIERVIPEILAFDSDLGAQGKEEVQRYDELRGQEEPAIRAICVVGRGHWYWYKDAWRTWPRTYPFEEVVGFVATIMNMYRKVAATRLEPRMGKYLTDR